jgi:hypothetical protein
MWLTIIVSDAEFFYFTYGLFFPKKILKGDIKVPLKVHSIWEVIEKYEKNGLTYLEKLKLRMIFSYKMESKLCSVHEKNASTDMLSEDIL